MKAPRSILALSFALLGFSAVRASADTAITSVPYTISASGHYYLSGNLNNSTVNTPAITVNSPNVVIDLNSYYVAGPGVASLGGHSNSVILVGNVANVTIKNGTISGAPYGVYFTASSVGTTSRNYVLDGLTVTRCYLGGIYFGGAAAPGSVIKNCAFSTIGSSTYSTNVTVFAIYTLGGIRIESNLISGVTPTGTGSGYGIDATRPTS